MSTVQTLVQATAQVVTVVNLKGGDVYKRLVKGYGDDAYKVQIGVVRDVMHNGEDAVITAMEFEASYSGIAPSLKVFGTSTDLKLFAAEPEEVRHHFAEVLSAGRDAVAKAEQELASKREVLATVERITSEESARALTAAEVVYTDEVSR